MAEQPPLVPATHAGFHNRVFGVAASLALRLSLRFTPRPAVWLIRKEFAAGGASTAGKLEPHRPAGVTALRNERYGRSPGEVFDVYRPTASGDALPTVVWVHGGGWVAGSKDELSAYLELIASKGYAVAAPSYALAPEQRYPTPLRQLMAALAHLEGDRERLGLDTTRVVLAGDSAGAQLTAQIAALVTTPGYAEAVGVTPTLPAAHLRGVVLACGPYDLALLQGASSPMARRLVSAVLWAYSGRRDFLGDGTFATLSVADHLTPAFPPALVTVGNADPLRRHSELLVERLRASGLEPETLFFPDDHEPGLGHEYQFDLDTDSGRLFFDRMAKFLERRLDGRDDRPEPAWPPAHPKG